MTYIDELMQRLFPPRPHPRVPQRLVHEVLHRGHRFVADYQSWRTSGAALTLAQQTARSYHLKKQGIDESPRVHLLESPYANGFALTCHETSDARTFSFLLEDWRERTLAMGYRQANATHEIRDRQTYLETSERYYLKPSLPFRPDHKCNQLFGNVQQELISINDRPSYLKVVVSVYADALYEPAAPFSAYVDQLFDAQPPPPAPV